MLRITIGNVQADGGDVGDGVQDQLDLLKVSIRRARADGNVVKYIWTLLGKGLPLVQRVVLVNAHKAAVLVETLGNVERASCVHIRRHHRHAGISASRIAEFVFAFKFHLKFKFELIYDVIMTVFS